MSTVQLPAVQSASYVRLTDSWTQLRYHPDQSRLWREKSRRVLVAAGRGSGKTEIARRRIVRHLRVKKPWRDPRYVYAMPTYRQSRDKIRDKILSLIPRQWFVKVPGDSAMEFKTIFGSWLFLYGMDVPARVEGDQYDGFVLDERSDIRNGAVSRSIRPALTHRNAWLWEIGVPKRYGCGAAEFKSAFKRGMNSESGLTSYTWSSEGVLTPEEWREAQLQTDAKDFDEQYRGNFVDAGGGAFYSYDANYNTAQCDWRPNDLIIVGCDFNVNPMAWVLCHIVEYLQPDGTRLRVLEVFDEIWLHDTNTRASLNVLWEKYGKRHRGGWLFVGDASAKARKTSAATSDITQIRNDKRFNAKVRFPKSNPPVRDRLSACNTLLCNAADQRRCMIDSVRCTRLMNDLDTRTLKPSGEPDDDAMTGHISDGWGYVVCQFFPLRLDSSADDGVAGISVQGT